MTNYLSRQQYSQAKARLTRAKKKGPQAVIEEVEFTYSAWTDGGYAWPDDWARWARAKEDANMELRWE